MTKRNETYDSFKNTIEHVDANETKICEVAKHPFGIILVYLQAGVGIVVALGLAYFLLPSVIDDVDQAFLFANLFAAVAIVFAIALVIITSVVYRQNRLIVTDRNITQILQYGLFSRKVSQLNMVNVEDVTSVQKGMFSTMFGFGELKIETAGEQSNFHFTYCPNPGYYAKIILNTREHILGQNDGDIRVDLGPDTTR
jgi:membrane protein YdbS with pleckstrin-like domain